MFSLKHYLHDCFHNMRVEIIVATIGEERVQTECESNTIKYRY